MAYLKRVTVGKVSYLYIVQSVRRGDSVTKKVLEYLGRDPSKARLAAAIKYWKVGVKKKPKKKGGRPWIHSGMS